MKLTLPHNGWRPRRHQMRLWRYLHEGGKRAVAVWHRRAGKDEICLHHAAVAAARRPGNYAHCLPEFAQGRRSIWTAVNPHTGVRRIDEAFPHAMRANTNDNEMFIRFINGSTWSVIGSDRYDNSIIGSSLAGIVFSEYALSNPSVWGYARPMLEENDGWAVFITTPRGRNHAYDLYRYAEHAPGWFCETLSVDKTGVLSPQQLDTALKEYCSIYGEDAGTATYRQELYCDWNAAVLGAFFAKELADVRAEGRVTPEVRAMIARPVHRSWDIGVRDSTAIWFFQVQGTQLIVLDCLEASGVGVDYYAEQIQARRAKHGWLDGNDYVPHDVAVKEWGSGRSRLETMTSIGLHPIPCPNVGLLDGINAARRTLPLTVFHTRCEPGLAALEQYKREWDDERKCYKANPLHDWTADYADSWRYASLSWRPQPALKVVPPTPRGIVIPPPAEPRRGGMQL